MKSWKRVWTVFLAMVVLVVSLPMQTLAANNWLKQAKDDNAQQLILLDRKSPQSYNFLITADPGKRQVLYDTAQELVVNCSTPQQKLNKIYDWVTQNIYYDWDGLNSGEYAPVDPYSVLTNQYAVCEGYATLLAELLNAVGIPSVTFHGASNSDAPGATRDDVSSWDESEYNNIDHAWNAAYLNGQWRYYDATWDSANAYVHGKFEPGKATRDYRGLSGAAIGANHRSAYLINDDGGFRRTPEGTWRRYDNAGKIYSGAGYEYYTYVVSYYQNGIPVTGKAIVNFQLASFDDKGVYLENCVNYNGWFLYEGNWYYLLGGVTCYGWGTFGGKTYYLDGDTCKMQVGWRMVDGIWYYFDQSGAMVTGWCKVGGSWYYFKSSGAMATGWCKVGGTWYYFKSSGAMATGWQKSGGKWYYLRKTGSMATGRISLGGKQYVLRADGSLA